MMRLRKEERTTPGHKATRLHNTATIAATNATQRCTRGRLRRTASRTICGVGQPQNVDDRADARKEVLQVVMDPSQHRCRIIGDCENKDPKQES